ncbi:MAG: DOPA 4,5-dioxygenase family protein [Pseudomonadota bacterium]
MSASADQSTKDPASIKGWHAHVYFTADQAARAQAVCEAVRDRFDIQMGRMHTDPVGPHPTGSCQLSVPPDRFAAVTGWLALNRDGLAVFCHAETGDVMADHTQHVLWLGDSVPLRLDVLRRLVEKD